MHSRCRQWKISAFRKQRGISRFVCFKPYCTKHKTHRDISQTRKRLTIQIPCVLFNMDAVRVAVVACAVVAWSTPIAAASVEEVHDARPWMNRADPPDERADKLIKEMTTAEKVAMLHGPPSGPCCQCKTNASCAYVGNVVPNKRLGIPPINMNDGPQGFRDNNNPGSTTAWPSGLTMAASWDVAAMLEWGTGMGKEFIAKGANVQLGPGLCVARVPRNGRNFEYLSGEDPILGYTLVQPVIKGIQSQGVVANAKHYVLNNQETNRNAVSELADERTRFEIYYPPFLGAVEADVGSIMCSYNKINGNWSCENPVTLGNDLKKVMGFEGWVMSDWGATHSTSINEGLDQEMPSAHFMGDALLQKIGNGVSEATLDASVRRILTTMFKVGVIDAPADTWSWEKLQRNVTSEGAAASARKLSAESHVLVKNDDAVLPIKKSAKIALIGLADNRTIVHAGGSGSVVPSFIATPQFGLAAAGCEDVTFKYGFDDVQGAAATAKESDIAIVFVGTLSSEGRDRPSLSLDDGGPESNQNELVAAIASAQPNTIVVMSVPGATLMPWYKDVKGVVVNFMPGQQAGNAVADVLTGAVNPSGKLPLTFPNKENETELSPAQWPGLPDPAKPTYAKYSEKLEVGYRYYDAHGIEFTTGACFGHGLSYTSFEYSDLVVSKREIRVTIKNTGSVAGAEVVQAYAALPSSAEEPPKRLVTFAKVLLEAGASTQVTMDIADIALSVWDVTSHSAVIPDGEFKIFVGSSSRDIRLTGSLTV
eukprot:m.441232 g.441232  ORF g.441232 m.441232 type:complete len:765 (+) comp21468_c0_seq4:58-2352(+)